MNEMINDIYLVVTEYSCIYVSLCLWIYMNNRKLYYI